MAVAEDGFPDGGGLFESAACGLLLTDAAGTIRRANAIFCTWLGYAPEELIEKRRIQDLLTMGGKVFHQTHWSPLLQMQGSIAEVKVDLVHRDGRHVPMLVNAMRRRRGDIIFDEIALLIVTDRHKYEIELLLARRNAEKALTELRLAEAQLTEADHRKDEFLATLAHELRNPLSPISNALQIMRSGPTNDKAPELLAMMDRQVKHLVRLIDDLLDVSRISKGKIELRKENITLQSAIQDAIDASLPLIDSNAHLLTLDLPEKPLWLHADPTRLSQIVSNLLNNAAKYTPRRGRITLAARGEKGEAVLSVIDNGVGIPPDMLPHVFDLFTQVDRTLERSRGGLGIGLALVKQLLEMHEGKIEAMSAGPNRGSTFTICLPIATAAVDEGTAAMPECASPTATTALRVLIVDDNAPSAQTVGWMLELDGHEPRLAHNAREALATASAFLPDAILLDIGLPDMDGYDLCRELRKDPRFENTLIIAQTGWGQARDRQLAAEAGFDHHLVKPFSSEQLSALLVAND